MPGPKIDDAEPRVNEPDVFIDIDPRVVRAAVRQRALHSQERIRLDAIAPSIDQAGNSTHMRVSLVPSGVRVASREIASHVRTDLLCDDPWRISKQVGQKMPV